MVVVGIQTVAFICTKGEVCDVWAYNPTHPGNVE